jgi:1-acyl-sn-glycerol-3-phosphate acyltransferase
MKSISKFILYTILGWKVPVDFPSHIDKYIIIAAPHTSNWDFPIAVLSKYAKGKDIRFIGKHTLFKPPFGFIVKALGGTPVNRNASSNMVQSIIDIFNEKDKFIFAISPEGTRKKVSKWKTGFYHVAKGAGVPIVMATLDFENKQILVAEPYYVTGDQKIDFKHFHDYFKDVKGKNPDQFDSDFYLNI